MTNTIANKCLFCQKTISIKAKYCSDKCRKAFSRKSDKQPGQIQPGQPKNTNPDKQPGQERELTPNEKSGITHPGKCHACNKDVSHLRCLCLECLNEGITHKSLSIDIKRCEEA